MQCSVTVHWGDLRTPQPHLAVGGTTDQPRFLRVPPQIQHPQSLLRRMAPQYLERHNKRIKHVIIIHRRVEDVDIPVVRTRSEQRQSRVESHSSQRARMIPQRAERFGGQVQVEPREFLVVRPDQEVVPCGMDVDAGYPFQARGECPHELLRGQIVEPDMALGRAEEPWFQGVESDALDGSSGFAEG